MNKTLFFIGWFCCCFSIHAQKREIPESEYGQFTFTYEQMLDLVKDKYNVSEINIPINAYYDPMDSVYYWRYNLDSHPLYNYLEVNAMTGDIHSEGHYYIPSPPKADSYCKVYYDPDLPIMKRRLLANFETVDLEEYNKYKDGENYSARILPGGIEGIWEKGDTAFRYYEYIVNKERVNIRLYKEFYANGNIKEKGLRVFMPNCLREIGLWYYFDPEGNLTEVVDKEGRELCLLTNEEMVAYCKERFGYCKRHDDEYRVRMAGLPDIRINKDVNYIRLKSEWDICWYAFEPYLVKIELKLEGKAEEGLSVISWRKTKVSLENALERLKAEKR